MEHDLRAKLLRLRQKAAGMLSDDGPAAPPAGSIRFRPSACSSGTRCILHGRRRAVEETGSDRAGRAAAFGFDAAPFEKLLDLREERIKPRDFDPVGAAGPYLQGIAAVIDAVDRLEK